MTYHGNHYHLAMKEIQKKRKEGDCVNDIMNDISNEYMNHLVTKYHINGVKL